MVLDLLRGLPCSHMTAHEHMLNLPDTDTNMVESVFVYVVAEPAVPGRLIGGMSGVKRKAVCCSLTLSCFPFLLGARTLPVICPCSRAASSCGLVALA